LTSGRGREGGRKEGRKGGRGHTFGCFLVVEKISPFCVADNLRGRHHAWRKGGREGGRGGKEGRREGEAEETW